jgi:Flp pilus assembly pilin Flp
MLRRRACSLAGDRAGVTSLEYAIMGSLVFAAVAGSLYGYGGGLSGLLASTFQTISGKM